MQFTERNFAAFSAKMASIYAEFRTKYQDFFDKIMPQWYALDLSPRRAKI